MSVNGITGLQATAASQTLRPEMNAPNASVGMGVGVAEQNKSGQDAQGVTPGIQKAPEVKPRVDYQELVLKLQEVPLKERMEQVISLEDVQRLLLMKAPYKIGAEPPMRIGAGSMIDFVT